MKWSSLRKQRVNSLQEGFKGFCPHQLGLRDPLSTPAPLLKTLGRGTSGCRCNKTFSRRYFRSGTIECLSLILFGILDAFTSLYGKLYHDGRN
jgi:hypothetical protein